MEESQCLVFETDRLQTFNKNWKPLNFKFCTPENFAAAGFYNCSSSEFSDAVKCFSCQKELSNWEEDDDPWSEHVKRGSKCPFVLFKSKENPTVQDFLELQYQTQKIFLSKHFDEEKKRLSETEKMLLKRLNNFKKSKN